MRFHRHSFRRNLSFLLNPIPSDREILFFLLCFTKIKSHKAFFFVYHRRHHHRLCLVRIFILLLLLVWLLIWDIVFHMNLAFYVLLLLFSYDKEQKFKSLYFFLFDVSFKMLVGTNNDVFCIFIYPQVSFCCSFFINQHLCILILNQLPTLIKLFKYFFFLGFN